MGRGAVWAASALLLALCLWPLANLFRYYDHQTAAGSTNAPYYAFFDDLAQRWQGEKVMVSDSMNDFKAIEYLLAVNHVPYDMLPLGRLLERLATGQETGRVTLLLTSDDRSRAQTQADLIVWDSAAMRASRKLGFGAYTVADARKVLRPGFVFADAASAPLVGAAQANLADQLRVIGFEVRPDRVAPGGELVVNVHWEAMSRMSEAYTGFLHLSGPQGRLVAQDDHELGRGFYRTLFWQPGQVVRERYAVTVPKDIESGTYSLWVGAYSFPSLTRLAVRSSASPVRDDAVLLGTIQVGP